MINIGIIGCANIALRSIIPSLIHLNDKFKILGIGSRNYQRVKEIAKKYGISNYGNYEDVLNLKDLNAIYIPLPNSLHYKWIKKALKKNIHTLVEKSLTCNYNDTLELNELAQKHKVILFENFQFRFHEQFQCIQNLIKDNFIGDVRYMRSSFCFPPFNDKTNIRYQSKLGGGSLLDAGAYPVKVSQLLLGFDLEVKSAVLEFNEKIGVDLWGGAFIQKKNSSIFSEIAFGFDNYYQCNLEIIGSKGKIFTDRIFTAPSDYTPKIIIENSDSKKKINIKPQNHFINMLNYFHLLQNDEKNKNNEYLANINQSFLLEKIRSRAQNEK